MRLVQISDCHVSADPAALYRGVDPRARLEAVLRAAAAWGPDLLVATGDLAEDGSEAAYRYLEARFERLGVPVLTLPGNHDRPGRLGEVFGRCPLHEPLVYDAAGWRLILLNSVVEDEVPGRLGERTLRGLEASLEAAGRPVGLFLHHQPVPVGSPWIDRYPLREPERLWSILDGAQLLRFVAWGHAHQHFEAVRGEVRLLGTPSSAIDSLPGREAFTPDPAGPGCRWLHLQPGGGFETGLIRPERAAHPLGSTSQRMT